MSTFRPVAFVADPTAAEEAEGVTIRRTVGGERLVLLDPYLLLDHLYAPAGTEPRAVGFPRHPHRGIETLTYVFTGGKVHHRDSLGNDDAIGAGGSQWMTAGGGIFHEEMLEAAPGEEVEALQIWFNLPAAEKMKRPAYQAAKDGDVPEVALPGGASVRVVSGTVGGATGPFTGIAVRPTYVDVRLPAGASVELPAPAGETAFAYVVRGGVTFGDGAGAKAAAGPQLAVFGTGGDTVRATASGDGEARFVFVSARPLNEPVLQYRSLVLNTVDQVREALKDIENGTFAKS
jgi:redox-sensitive bicupin YhaK (pirin superfamily)